MKSEIAAAMPDAAEAPAAEAGSIPSSCVQNASSIFFAIASSAPAARRREGWRERTVVSSRADAISSGKCEVET